MAAMDVVQCNTGTRNMCTCMYNAIVMKKEQSETLYTGKEAQV
jgi:hypothetical protein